MQFVCSLSVEFELIFDPVESGFTGCGLNLLTNWHRQTSVGTFYSSPVCTPIDGLSKTLQKVDSVLLVCAD